MHTRYGVSSPTCDLAVLKIEYERLGHEKKKRFASKALAFIAVYLVAFSIWQCLSFAFTQVEQTQLIESTFTVIGLECGGLLFKRIIDKIFNKKEENTEE